MGSTSHRLQLDADHQARWQIAVGRFVLAFGSMEAAAIEMQMEVSPVGPTKRLTFASRLDMALAAFEGLPNDKATRLCQALLAVKRLKRFRNSICHSPTHYQIRQLGNTAPTLCLTLICWQGGESLSLSEVEALSARADRLARALFSRWRRFDRCADGP